MPESLEDVSDFGFLDTVLSMFDSQYVIAIFQVEARPTSGKLPADLLENALCMGAIRNARPVYSDLRHFIGDRFA